MTTIDIILIVFIGLVAIFGFIRGVVSQAMSIVGLVTAYFFSAPLSAHFVKHIASGMGSTESYARPFAVMSAAILIYVACRLLGFAFEKIFISQSDSLKGLNRIGGGFLGAIKGCILLFIAFYILRLVPQDTLEAHAPKVVHSKMYQFFAHNQLFDQKYIDTLAEPVYKSANQLTKPQETQVPQTTDDLIKSITDAKSKKTIEKTESKMNNEELNKILTKQAPKKAVAKKKAKVAPTAPVAEPAPITN